MDNRIYFESLTSEIKSLQNRIRYYIGGRHCPTDGEWKERVLKSILRRHLPYNIGVGSGFIVTPSGPSKQIDILIYDKSKPILFEDGDFVLVTQDATLGIIEVKTNITMSDLPKTLNKINDNVKLSRSGYAACPPVSGLFVYESQNFDSQRVLTIIKDTFKGVDADPINILCFGESFFIRFWDHNPDNPSERCCKWRSYKLDGTSPAYFIHNVLSHICHFSVRMNNELWFPEGGKEQYFLHEIEMDRSKNIQ